MIETLLDKWLLAETLERLDVPHPTTHNLIDESTLDNADGSFFLKPLHSHLFYDATGRKAFRFNNRAEAIDHLRSITRAGLKAVLQERIPGPPTTSFHIDGFVDRLGIVRAWFARRRVRMFPLDFGNSSMTVSISPDEVRDASDHLDRLLTGIGYRGAFDAEFKRDPRDGIAKLLEVNCRPWWWISFVAHCGIDITMMIYRDALGLPISSTRTYPVGERGGYFSNDVKAYRALRASGELSLRRWLASWIGTTPLTFTIDDPLPAISTKIPTL